jgi:hypothetical protein
MSAFDDAVHVLKVGGWIVVLLGAGVVAYRFLASTLHSVGGILETIGDVFARKTCENCAAVFKKEDGTKCGPWHFYQAHHGDPRSKSPHLPAKTHYEFCRTCWDTLKTPRHGT